MQYIHKSIRRDIVKELSTNYSVDCGDERWKSIIYAEVDEILMDYKFSFDKNLKKGNYVDRRLFNLDETNCQARVWNEGCGGQCSRKKKFGDFCGKHCGGKSWCGIISEPRPEHPVNSTGKIHTWKS